MPNGGAACQNPSLQRPTPNGYPRRAHKHSDVLRLRQLRLLRCKVVGAYRARRCAWCYRINVGQTTTPGAADSKRAAADRVSALWSDLVRQEQARVSKIEAQRHLEHQIDEAHRTGRVDVMAFGPDPSDYERLLKINDLLRAKNMPSGPLKPLADEAIISPSSGRSTATW